MSGVQPKTKGDTVLGQVSESLRLAEFTSVVELLVATAASLLKNVLSVLGFTGDDGFGGISCV